MKKIADTRWDKMASALIASRDSWRQIIAKPFMPGRALRRLAEENSARITAALKNPSQPAASGDRP
jgi:hypothetical protein